MLNFQAMRLLHRHDDEYVPMVEHAAEAHDPERALLRGERRGARIFRCATCPEEIAVVPATEGTGEAPPPA